MKIKSLRQPQHPQGRVRITFEDGSVLAVLPVVAAEQGLYQGMELDATALEALRQAAGAASAKNRAVRILSATGVTRAELERRLVQKGEAEPDARAAVEWLDELRLLDDAEVARQIVSRGVSRGYGRARIRQMLYEKRVPKEYWEDALAQMPEMDDEIDRFLQRKLNGSKPDRKELNRVLNALARRGFSWSEIQAGLRRYEICLEDEWEE